MPGAPTFNHDEFIAGPQAGVADPRALATLMTCTDAKACAVMILQVVISRMLARLYDGVPS